MDISIEEGEKLKPMVVLETTENQSDRSPKKLEEEKKSDSVQLPRHGGQDATSWGLKQN